MALLHKTVILKGVLVARCTNQAWLVCGWSIHHHTQDRRSSTRSGEAFNKPSCYCVTIQTYYHLRNNIHFVQ